MKWRQFGIRLPVEFTVSVPDTGDIDADRCEAEEIVEQVSAGLRNMPTPIGVSELEPDPMECYPEDLGVIDDEEDL